MVVISRFTIQLRWSRNPGGVSKFRDIPVTFKACLELGMTSHGLGRSRNTASAT